MEQPTFGQRLADATAASIGSWPFIIGQAVFLLCWFVLNTVGLVHHWDPYPWMAANIVMSAEAAFTGPILLIASNVAAARDRKQVDRIESLEDRSVKLEEAHDLHDQDMRARLTNLETKLDTLLTELVHP